MICKGDRFCRCERCKPSLAHEAACSHAGRIAFGLVGLSCLFFAVLLVRLT